MATGKKTDTDRVIKVGDPVEVDFADLPEGMALPNKEKMSREKAVIIGVLGKIDEGTMPVTASVIEVHAFHYLWGGSNGGRGKVHVVPLSVVQACPQRVVHIVKEQAKKSRIRNILDELAAPEHP